ncbi:hypothetical protein KP509_11G034700 [Ceratopteris richardii]|uniref:Uncharacterized protein n=1 Tax=Ceratopteris richardii TaxID=49495 RepID=A0A8T2TNB7_CERRI|nr:hypothetical protein KP509_11G034700 [Ceratopteris richardii]
MQGCASRTAQCPNPGVTSLEKGSADLFSPLSEGHEHLNARDISEPPKPFASFGSFRQRHGGAYDFDYSRTIEAPARLESSAASSRADLSQTLTMKNINCEGQAMPVFADYPLPASKRLLHPLHKTHTTGKHCSTDLDREEAWERKREQYLVQEEDEEYDEDEEFGADEGFSDALSEHSGEDTSSEDEERSKVSSNTDESAFSGQCKLEIGDTIEEPQPHALNPNEMRKARKRMQSFRRKSLPRPSAKPLRAKSLTDEDLEELRGSIDLGFRFSYNEPSRLKNTLPALELYCAINRNYADAQSRSSPNSPLNGNVLHRTNSSGSATSPSNENWRISSPGDHPSEVKTRLRHWAQVVACSVKQGTNMIA